MPEREGYFIKECDADKNRMITPIGSERRNQTAGYQRTDANWVFDPVKVVVLHAFDKRIDNICDIDQSENTEEPFSSRKEVIAITGIFLHAVRKEQRAEQKIKPGIENDEEILLEGP